MPRTPRYRHIVRIANRQLQLLFPGKPDAADDLLARRLSNPGANSPGPTKVLSLLMIAALHQGNYATIPNYLEGELRYMEAGE